MNLRLSFADSLEDRCRMLFDKIGELAPGDQGANLRKTPGRTRLLAEMIKSLMLVVMMLVVMISMIVMLMIVMLMIVMLMIVMLMIVMLMIVMLMIVMALLRGIVRCSGMNVEFHPGNACASLSLEMKVAIAQLQFRELPFESGRGDSEIGQSADRHVAADPRKAVQVKDTHGDLPTLKTGCYTRVLLKPWTAF
jgi:hypothetical protein